jgi:hypothetical protein
MALFVMAALSPRYRAGTVRQLEQLGFRGALPVVRRTLVLCPPHLLGSWRDQAEAVVPEARVQVVESAADLAVDAELYVLSRETAKLGHGYEGVEGRCPGCGAAVAKGARANASRRLRCKAEERRPGNLFARLAVELASVMVPALPGEDLVASLAPARWVAVCGGREPVAVGADRVACFAEGLFGPLREALEDRGADRRYSVALPLLTVLEKMARAGTGSVEVLADRLAELAGSLSNGGNVRFLRQHVQGLRGRSGWVSGPAEDVLVAALEELDELAEWHEEGVCGEPLFQAVPPRRVPLAKWILRSCRQLEL